MFSGAVTSSPVKRKLRSDFLHSPDESFLSPDSSYILDSSDCCCRRSPRLLTNGYYDVSQGSFTWDEDGNVSLATSKTSVCYKENLVRVFRRRRRPRSALSTLLHDVKENCQSWLFGGVFGSNRGDRDLDLSESQETSPADSPVWELEPQWERSRSEEEVWSRLNSTEVEEHTAFVYDPTEAPPPPDKPLIQEVIDTFPSPDTFVQSEGGLSEVPPVSNYQTSPCQMSQEKNGLSARGLLLLFLTLFIMAALYSRCWWWSSAVVVTAFSALSTVMMVTKSGPMGEWRKAKTEDITSRNE